MEKFADFGVDAANLAAVLGVEVAQNVLDQQGQIFLAVAQRRQMDVEDVQAEVEVLAKLAAGHGLLGILVGGGEHAHVHGRFGLLPRRRTLRSSSTRSSLACVGGGISPISSRSSVPPSASSKQPMRRSAAPVKAPRLVAEDFALHERFGNGGAVDGHEGPFGARRKLMEWCGPGSPCPTRSRR